MAALESTATQGHDC